MNREAELEIDLKCDVCNTTVTQKAQRPAEKKALYDKFLKGNWRCEACSQPYYE